MLVLLITEASHGILEAKLSVLLVTDTMGVKHHTGVASCVGVGVGVRGHFALVAIKLSPSDACIHDHVFAHLVIPDLSI